MTMPINDDNSDCDDQQHTASMGLFMITIMQNPIILMTMLINDDGDDQQHTASLGLFMMTIMQNPIILMTMPINDDGNGGSYANAEPDADD